MLVKGRVSNDADGFARQLEMLADAGDSPEDPIPIAIETDRGLWVATLRATGRPVYAINPLSASVIAASAPCQARSPMQRTQ